MMLLCVCVCIQLYTLIACKKDLTIVYVSGIRWPSSHCIVILFVFVFIFATAAVAVLVAADLLFTFFVCYASCFIQWAVQFVICVQYALNTSYTLHLHMIIESASFSSTHYIM